MISFIIPTLNEESFIGATLEKLVAGLETTPHEIIISDGGSTDRTVAIARQYDVKIVTDPEPAKKNIARGRNLGAAAASGDFLIFMDADITIPHPDDFLHRALSFFERDVRLKGLMVRIRVLPECATLADRLCFGGVNFLYFLANNILHKGGAPGEFQMMRSHDFRTIGGYREDLIVSEDNDLFMRLAKIGRTRFERSLTVFHTGRRAHIIGWPRLLFTWWMNALWVFLFNRSWSKVWKPVRTKEDGRM